MKLMRVVEDGTLDQVVIQPYDVVAVDWLDSVHTGGWLNFSEIDVATHEQALYHHSVGYVMRTEGAALWLIQSLQDRWVEGNPLYVDSVMRIPKCAVLRISILARKIDEQS